jgi:hypothetical protein
MKINLKIESSVTTENDITSVKNDSDGYYYIVVGGRLKVLEVGKSLRFGANKATIITDKIDDIILYNPKELERFQNAQNT